MHYCRCDFWNLDTTHPHKLLTYWSKRWNLVRPWHSLQISSSRTKRTHCTQAPSHNKLWIAWSFPSIHLIRENKVYNTGPSHHLHLLVNYSHLSSTLRNQTQDFMSKQKALQSIVRLLLHKYTASLQTTANQHEWKTSPHKELLGTKLSSWCSPAVSAIPPSLVKQYSGACHAASSSTAPTSKLIT